MTTVDDAVEAGARSLADEWNTGERRAAHSAVAFVAARAMWPVLSARLRQLHRERDSECPECFRFWPCTVADELDRIDKELGVNQSGDPS